MRDEWPLWRQRVSKLFSGQSSPLRPAQRSMTLSTEVPPRPLPGPASLGLDGFGMAQLSTALAEARHSPTLTCSMAGRQNFCCLPGRGPTYASKVADSLTMACA